MGTDKGLIKLHAGTWAQSAANKMNALNLPVALSINEQQLDAYSAFFSPSSLIIDKSTPQIHGPLCGLLSVHADHPDEDLMILGCDLPLMEVELLKELLQRAFRQRRSSLALTLTHARFYFGLVHFHPDRNNGRLYLSHEIRKSAGLYRLGRLRRRADGTLIRAGAHYKRDEPESSDGAEKSRLAS